MDPIYLKRTNARDLLPDAEVYFLPIHKMYLGVAVSKLLCRTENAREREKVQDFFNRCRSFLITLGKTSKTLKHHQLM
jgi:hypothetical protein